MRWYDEHIVYGDGVLRPRVAAVGVGVHKFVSQVESGKLPQVVVQEFNAVHGGDPELTVVEVEAALDYARDYPDEVERIIQEQERLLEAQLECPEDAVVAVNEEEFEYFDVSARLEDGDDGSVEVVFEYGE